MGSLTVRRLTASVLLTVALSALTGCGDSSEQAQDPASSPSATTSESPESEDAEPDAEPEGEPTSEVPENAPDCQQVWAEGSSIPRTYQGCVDDAGAYVERDAVGCSSGQRLVVFDDAYWGFPGGTVFEAKGSLDQDREYRAATRRCAA